MLPLLVLAWSVQASTLPAIKIDPGPGPDFVLQIEPFEQRRYDEVKIAAARAAVAACGSRPIGWGIAKYANNIARDGSGTTKIVGFRQTFRCLDLDPAKYAHAPAGWNATEVDQAAASRTFSTYFDARDSGALDQVFSMLEPNSRGNREEWMANQRLARSMLAGKGSRSLTGIAWYLDPPEAPFPGIFARLTFTGKAPGTIVYCGSMVLYRAAPDQYLVGGVKENFLTPSDHPTPAQVVAYRSAACE